MDKFSTIIYEGLYPEDCGLSDDFSVQALIYFNNLPDKQEFIKEIEEKLLHLREFTAFPEKTCSLPGG